MEYLEMGQEKACAGSREGNNGWGSKAIVKVTSLGRTENSPETRNTERCRKRKKNIISKRGPGHGYSRCVSQRTAELKKRKKIRRNHK